MKRKIMKHLVLGSLVFAIAICLSLFGSVNAKELASGNVKLKGSKSIKAGAKDVTKADVPSDVATVYITNSGNNIVISGSIPSKYIGNPNYYNFGILFVDGVQVADFTGTTAISKQTVSLNNFDTGYHTAFLQLRQNTTVVDLLYKTKVYVNKITAKPSYNGVFNVYSTNFNYYPYDLVSNQAGPLYMEYKPSKSSAWYRTGKMVANQIKLKLDQGFNMSGLKSDTVYNTRIRYGSYVTYPTDYLGDGKTYFFGGPVLNTTTIKTGKAKKPKIKSVKVKAIKIKYHKHRVAGHYYWTGYHYVWIGPYTERYYTCKYKVTIKLKKKPGTKGIWVNGKYLKGNKKTYKTTFTPYPNYFTKKPPKKLKYKVTIKSYQSKDYGGFSPAYSKTKKVK